MKKLKIGFIWESSSKPEVFNHWNDGLREALRIMEKKCEITFYEPLDDIEGEDVLLYWESPITINGKNAEGYKKVMSNPTPKALLFAGGSIIDEALSTFDIIFTESQINDDEFEAKGYNYMRAFGINDRIFKPMNYPKVYDGFHQATFAGWKRQPLSVKALGKKMALAGRFQPTDPTPYNDSVKLGAQVFTELSYEEVAKKINQSHTVVNTSEFWGGGQRATLEAMACGVPPIVMSDSPKNMEYVRNSGFGLIVDPTPEAIKEAVKEIKGGLKFEGNGREYIKSLWTAEHYAERLINGIRTII